MRDNKPCVNNQGKLYWPKVNSTVENNDPNNVGAVFSKELHGTPHECSKCHTSADFEFVYHFHRNVQ